MDYHRKPAGRHSCKYQLESVLNVVDFPAEGQGEGFPCTVALKAGFCWKTTGVIAPSLTMNSILIL